jgi:tRNA threonylcarbamoyladenosine biosynthesis protein TsaB
MTEQIRAFYPDNYVLCPMIDARRMEVYCTFYSAANGRELQSTSAQIINEESFGDWLAQGPVVFFGDGAAKCRAVLGGHPNAVFVDQLIVPSARTVGTLATPAVAEGRFENVATFEPFYLKEFMTAKPKQAML